MNKTQLLTELNFKSSRSSGPGGQHVNKTSTRIELFWEVGTTQAFTQNQIDRIREKLSNRITKEDVLQLASEKTRSQLRNKEAAIDLFFDILEQALHIPKRRKKTRPSKMARLKRLKAKKQHGEKKANRKKPDY